MAKEMGFRVDRRVAIAMDALSPAQQKALQPVLSDKKRFLAEASAPGRSTKLSATRPIYAMKAGSRLRIIYSREGDDVAVLDVMRKEVMSQLAAKKKVKKLAVTKKDGPPALKRSETGKIKKS